MAAKSQDGSEEWGYVEVRPSKPNCFLSLYLINIYFLTMPQIGSSDLIFPSLFVNRGAHVLVAV